MTKLLAIPSSVLVRNTMLATGWQGIRVALQAGWVILLARAVGPGEYGSFAGMAGLAAAMGSLTGLGFGMLMMQDASRNHAHFSTAWKRAFLMTLISGLVLWAIYMVVAPLLFRTHMGLWSYAAIGLPELVCFPVTIVAAYAFQLHERMGWAGALFTLITIGNLIAVTAFLLAAPTKMLTFYLPFHAAGSILAAGCAVAFVIRLLAPSAAAFSLTRRDMHEGFGFSLMRIADTGMTSLDKTLVLLLAGPQVAGIYSSAYRLVAVLAMPATSLGMAALPRLFRTHLAKPGGLARKSNFVTMLLAATAVYGLVAAVLAYLLSGVLPILFGTAFEQAAQAARWLAISPLLYGVYALGCNVLVTSHRRTLRILAQAAGIAILVASAWLWVPKFGLKGAVGMLLFTQCATALLLWLLVGWSRNRNETHPDTEAMS
jgi:O-antigen/teichoic acid export membrane protein